MINGLDMNQLLEKAKDLQKSLAQKKEEAASKTVDVSVGGGMVSMKMNGNLELLSIKIDPEIVDKDDVDTMEDLIRAGLNEALRQAKELGSSGLSDIMGDFNIPDLGNFGK